MHVRRLPRFAAPCRLMQIVTVLGETIGDGRARPYRGAGGARRGLIVPIAGKYARARVRRRHVGVGAPHRIRQLYAAARRRLRRRRSIPTHFEPQLATDPRRHARRGRPRDADRCCSPPTRPIRRPRTLPRWFAADATVVCDVADGAARVMSDFRLHGRRLRPAAGARPRARRRRARAADPAAAGARQLPQHGAARPAAGAASDARRDRAGDAAGRTDPRGVGARRRRTTSCSTN